MISQLNIYTTFIPVFHNTRSFAMLRTELHSSWRYWKSNIVCIQNFV